MALILTSSPRLVVVEPFEGWIEVDATNISVADPMKGKSDSFGKLEEIQIVKEFDETNSLLFSQAAITGESLGSADICFVRVVQPGPGDPVSLHCYLHYKVDNVVVTNWSLSVEDAGSGEIPTEVMTWDYDKIAAAASIQIFPEDPIARSTSMSWDEILEGPWSSILESLWEIMGL